MKKIITSEDTQAHCDVCDEDVATVFKVNDCWTCAGCVVDQVEPSALLTVVEKREGANGNVLLGMTHLQGVLKQRVSDLRKALASINSLINKQGLRVDIPSVVQITMGAFNRDDAADHGELKLAVNDVVQLSPETAKNKTFGGCFMVVTEVRSWGAQGFVAVPDERGKPCQHAYYRATWEEMERVGVTRWVLSEE